MTVGAAALLNIGLLVLAVMLSTGIANHMH